MKQVKRDDGSVNLIQSVLRPAFGGLQEVQRDDGSDVVFSTEEGKWKAVLREVAYMHETGRPVLVGTTSVERSEYLADLLSDKGIKFQVHFVAPEHLQSNLDEAYGFGSKSFLLSRCT